MACRPSLLLRRNVHFLPHVHQDWREYSETLVLPVHVPDTRVVHLELVHSMDRDDFIPCFKRLKKLRRNVVQLRCDRGTNFVHSEKELRESLEQWNQHQTGREQIQQICKWKKKMKSIMETQMVKAILQTLLTEVEQALNGCALTAEEIVSVSSIITSKREMAKSST